MLLRVKFEIVLTFIVAMQRNITINIKAGDPWVYVQLIQAQNMRDNNTNKSATESQT